MRLLDVAQKLVALYGSPHLGPVTEILHARLLAVAIKSASGVNESERQKLLEQWERVTFRIFELHDKDSRTKVGDYVRLASNIVSEDIETRTYNQIMSGLRDLGREYPIDEAFEKWSAEDCYDHPEETRYLLWSYEEHLAQELGGSSTIDENDKTRIWRLRAADSIEHIFPQTPSGTAWRGKMRRTPDAPTQSLEKNVGRIGNLLLLPIKLNEEAQNSLFSRKKEIYERHNLRMVHEVCACTDWTLAEIDHREAKIIAWAKTRWCDV
jgi:hypothetical protein